MANEIVLVQPLHHDDNGAGAFIVYPAVKGVAEPVVGRLPLGGGQRLLWLEGIVDHDDVGPPSVSTPPFDVASR